MEVFFPENIKELNQIFTRDVGFVIEDKFFISNIIQDRTLEINGLEEILQNINSDNKGHITNYNCNNDQQYLNNSIYSF